MPILQGSFEGDEPFDEVEPFKGHTDWKALEPAFLDAHAGALSFFTPAAFRFYLPAYLVADLQGQLKTADPEFHLTHGFTDNMVEIPTPVRLFKRTIGKSELVNPRRYGAMTFHDYARYRLSVFTREEAAAICTYLEYRTHAATHDFEKPHLQAALDAFWLERARSAPTAESLRQYLAEQAEFIEAIQKGNNFRWKTACYNWPRTQTNASPGGAIRKPERTATCGSSKKCFRLRVTRKSTLASAAATRMGASAAWRIQSSRANTVSAGGSGRISKPEFRIAWRNSGRMRGILRATARSVSTITCSETSRLTCPGLT